MQQLLLCVLASFLPLNAHSAALDACCGRHMHAAGTNQLGAPPASHSSQWVFYLFGASAALWLPFWLPLRMEGGSRSGGSGGSSKSFNVLALFSSGDAADGSSRGGGSGLQGLPDSSTPREGSRLQRVPTALSDDFAGGRGGEQLGARCADVTACWLLLWLVLGAPRADMQLPLWSHHRRTAPLHPTPILP